MLRGEVAARHFGEEGDTLIEVAIALSILAFVLLSSTAVVTVALRTGQTAKERTIVAEAAQEQMEELRSYRDNNDWPTFLAGVTASPGGFYMQQQTVGGVTSWVPVTGSTAASSLVPTSTLKITTPIDATSVAAQQCDIDLTLSYNFQTEGGSVPASNTIKVRLTNLHYVPPGGVADCLT